MTEPTLPRPCYTHPLEILWQDEDMVVVYKPAGWLVHRTALARHETRFVLQSLRDQIGQHVWPVHRLDQGTCGVLVFALNQEACRRLAAAFMGRACQIRGSSASSLLEGERHRGG